MSYQVLARKYRPQKFSDVIGQDHVTRTLKNAIEQGRIAHGYIFSGHRGIGKTTIARILAMALNCQSQDHPVPEPCGVCDSCREIRAGNAVDVIEIDAATNRGIDEIRELREAARYRPARDRYKIYILDEAHQITDAAFNALLKTLEEPPGHIVFMMATTQPEDIPQTIRSRCQHFSFHAVRFDDIVQQLRDIASRRASPLTMTRWPCWPKSATAPCATRSASWTRPSPAAAPRSAPMWCAGWSEPFPAEVLEDVMDAVARNSSEDVLRMVDRLLVEGQSAQHFARQMVRFLRNALVAKVAGSDSPVLQISADERARVARVAERFSEEDLSRFMQIMLRTHGELGYKQEQRFHLELGLLKLVHAQRLLPLEQLLSGEAAQPKTGGASEMPRAGSAPAAAALRGGRALGSARAIEAEVPSRAPAASPFSRPSPFEADRSRKSEPKGEARFEASGPLAAVAAAPSRIGLADIEATAERGSAVATAIAEQSDEAGEARPQDENGRCGAERGAVRAGRLGPEDAGAQPGRRRVVAGRLRSRGEGRDVAGADRRGAGRRAETHHPGGAGPVSGAPLKFKMVGGATPTAVKPGPAARPVNGANGASARAAPWPIRWCSACRKNSAPKFAPSSTRKTGDKDQVHHGSTEYAELFGSGSV